MLKQRIITAVVLVAALLLSLIASNPIYWQVFISVALLGAFYEWLRFCGVERPIEMVIGYLIFIIGAIILKSGLVEFNILVPVLIALWIAILMFTFFNVFAFINQKWIKLIVGVIILDSAGWIITELKSIPNGIVWVVVFFLTVVAADVGAYFSGKRFGKNKLAPKISPGKTVEGLVGGLILVLLIFIPYLYFSYEIYAASILLLAIVVTALVSVGGDLFESKLKREVGLKDSSQILPGHGGILDRVDSLMAGLPFFAAGLLILGILK